MILSHTAGNCRIVPRDICTCAIAIESESGNYARKSTLSRLNIVTAAAIASEA
jgi:ABC-type tungstate transport system substrate-binding protein